MTNKLLIFVSMLAMASCSTEDPKQKGSRSGVSDAEQAAKAADPDAKQGEVKKASGTTPVSPLPSGSPAPVDPAVEQFFHLTVEVAFEKNCASCHAEPRFKPATPGPLSIFSYEKMRGMLLRGVSEQSNTLIDKVRGIASHTGGNRCASGLGAAPCAELIQWFNLEIKSNPGALVSPGAAGVDGALASTSMTGRMTGWAVNTSDTTQAVSIKIFAGGPAETGTLIGTVPANLTGASKSYPGNHSFGFDLPATYANGVTRDMYIYATIAGVDKAIPGNPYKVTAYTPKQAGRDYYEASLRPQLQTTCGGCHLVSYAQHYSSLIFAAPHAGGTALDNEMINRPSGGLGHRGGNLCGNKNAGVCVQIQQWWAREFGP